VSREYADFMAHHPAGLDRGTVSGRVMLDRKIVHVPDVLADPEYTYSELQKIGGYRTALGVPLLREGTPIGVMAMNRCAVRPFPAKPAGGAPLFGRPGGDGDENPPPAQRAARIAAAADRHRRRTQGHQPFDVRSAGSAANAR